MPVLMKYFKISVLAFVVIIIINTGMNANAQSLQAPCSDNCYMCLFGAKPDNPDVKTFLSSNNIQPISTLEQEKIKDYIWYHTEKGQIKSLTLYDLNLLNNELKPFQFKITQTYSEFRASADSLPEARKIKDEEIIITRSPATLMYKITYKWNGLKGKQKDFIFHKLEVSYPYDFNKNYIAESCKYRFTGLIPDFCIEGNCLMCYIGRSSTEIADMKNYLGAKMVYSYSNQSFEHNGVKIYIDDGKINKILMDVRAYEGNLPLGIQRSESKEDLIKRLAMQPDKDGNLIYNYYGVRVEVIFVQSSGTMLLVSLIPSAYAKDMPICDLNEPKPVVKLGCLKGDCVNGFGRTRIMSMYSKDSYYEYEGNFKNGKPDGDGCKIVNDKYEFGNFTNGERTGSLTAKLCVDDTCSDPTIVAINTQVQTKSNIRPGDIDFTNVSSNEKNIEKEREENIENHLRNAAEETKEKYDAGWYSVSNYAYHFTKLKADDKWLEKSFYVTKGYKNKIVIIVPPYSETIEMYLKGDENNKKFSDYRSSGKMQIFHYDFIAQTSGYIIFKYRFGAINKKIQYRVLFFREPF